MQTTASLLTEQISVPSAEIALELRYRQIGIACVAAAARYQTRTKSPAAQNALVEPRDAAPVSWH